MKYEYRQRLIIGKEIYTHKLNCYEASIKYNISYWTLLEPQCGQIGSVDDKV